MGCSANVICWFDLEHSGSADPDTCRNAMLEEYCNIKKYDKDKKSLEGNFDPKNKKGWNYLRVGGLGFVPNPFVCCPHHDKTQSNSLLQVHNFDEMLLSRAQSSTKYSILNYNAIQNLEYNASMQICGVT